MGGLAGSVNNMVPGGLGMAPLSNGSVDDLRRHQYDDFGESDDDLRREDIMFPSEAGKSQ